MRELRYLLLIIIYVSGCAITDEKRYERLSYIDIIEKDFSAFVADCRFTAGHLYVPRRRVRNAPPTPWEMQDAVCYYDDMYSYGLDSL